MLIKKKIVNECADTILDSIYENLTEYMFQYGNYSETDDKFSKDHSNYMEAIIKELYKRINK
tara:strand:- start:9117 stop:9302 length:186 start_codon:yes stop_codon:yes gene_type:complete